MLRVVLNKLLVGLLNLTTI